MNNVGAPELLTADDVAALLGVSRRTLSRWKRLRKGPPRIKVGRAMLYNQASLHEWLRSLEDFDFAPGCSGKQAR